MYIIDIHFSYQSNKKITTI